MGVVLADVDQPDVQRGAHRVSAVTFRDRQNPNAPGITTGPRDPVADPLEVRYEIHVIVAKRAASWRARQEK